MHLVETLVYRILSPCTQRRVQETPGCHPVDTLRFKKMKDQNSQRLRRSHQVATLRDFRLCRFEMTFKLFEYMSLKGLLRRDDLIDDKRFGRSLPVSQQSFDNNSVTS